MDKLKAEQQQQQRLDLAEGRAASASAQAEELAGQRNLLFKQNQNLLEEGRKLRKEVAKEVEPMLRQTKVDTRYYR